MLLNQLVRINEQGLVANAVSFELMDDPDKNLRLCQGFVFNYDSDPKKLKSSTVGVLDSLWRSFHSPNEPNIHLMVQDYGKGKSHFALAVANFFKKPYDSPEVQGVLQQVEYATSSTNGILQSLRVYKQRGRHLVICLSGDKPIDLKKHFLQVLRKALDDEGITNSIAQQICKQPLDYLQSLDEKQREAAEAFLERKGNPEGDINTIAQLLQNDNYQVIPRVKEICRELTGVTPDFDADVDVEAILTDLITRLCTGAHPHFQGIVLLFDELYNYLQLWANDPVRAGSTTLQNITNICERFKGRIALIGFTQRRPNSVIPTKNVEDYNRLVSRLELLPSTYEPAASLELVLNGLLSQQEKTAAWQEFYSTWRNTLTAINTSIYQNRTANYYQSRNWSSEKFLTHMTLGCFPLHPLTSYLLCNLDFTQGRTAIQFVQQDVKSFILQPVENNGSLNLIYPVALVDAFEGNFSNPESNPEYSTVFSDYNHSANKIKTSADAELQEMLVLKALLLFYTSSGKLKKSDREKHEEILSILTGLSVLKVKDTLDKLCQMREVIYHNPADNTYRFFSGGFGIDELRRRIKEETAHKTTSIERVETYCQLNITDSQYAGSDTIPIQFVEENRLRVEDWKFHNKVYSLAKFKKALLSEQTVRNIDALGIVAYVVAETSEELSALRSEIDQLLERSPIKGQVMVAISSQPAGNLARLLLEFDTVKKKSVQEFGAALTQLQQQYQKQIHDSTLELFKSCTYHCHIIEKIPTGDRTNPSRVVSAILQDRYPLIPPVDKNDKMHLKSTTGSEVIGYVSKRLLENDLRPHAFPKKSYDSVVKPVFVTSWGLLKLTSQQYSVVVPSQRNIKAAWEKISEMTALGEQPEKVFEITKIWETLSSPPYGHNEYTFTILFAAWLAYHRTEIFLKGGFGIPEKKLDQVYLKTEPIPAWANTNILTKPKDFIREWVMKGKPQLIRRQPLSCPDVPNSVDYEQAKQFIQQINNFLAGVPDPAKVAPLSNTRQWLTNGVERIDELFKPVAKAEKLLSGKPGIADIDSLVRICSQLQQPLPAIAEGGKSINPTEQQQSQRQQVLQAVIEKIGQVVEAESERSVSLCTEADCGAYKANIQRTIASISQVADLPPRFFDILQDALRKADSTLAEIVELHKVEDCLLQIQSLYKLLGELATQNDYVRTQSEIEKLVESVPAARETDIYSQIIQSLEEKQDALIRQVANWESQFSPTILREQAVQLSQLINRQLNRFTDSDSQQRLNELLRKLDNIVLERESEEQESEQIQNIITSAKRKLKDVKTFTNLYDVFQAYQNLSSLTITPIKGALGEKNQKKIENCKLEAYTAICDKFAQLVDKCHQINQTKDYENLKNLIQKSQSLITDYEEFADVRNKLSEAERNLEVQHEDLQKRLQDKRTMETIQQHTLAKANTIHLCEEASRAIASLRSQLNYPEQFTSDVEHRMRAFTDKVTTYKKKLLALSDRLSQVETSKQLDSIRDEYAKLDLIFKDSSEYPTYQQLQGQIRLLAEDLDILSNLEILYQQSHSIESSDRTLEIINNSQLNLHDLDRFKPQLLQLEEQLRQRKQGYIEQRKNTAKSWLERLENQDSCLELFTNPDQKLEAATQLLNEITKQRNQHEEILEAESKQTLERIITRCIEIQNQDRESKILVLFQQLPLEQRQSLLKRLADYVSDTKEEFYTAEKL